MFALRLVFSALIVRLYMVCPALAQLPAAPRLNFVNAQEVISTRLDDYVVSVSSANLNQDEFPEIIGAGVNGVIVYYNEAGVLQEPLLLSLPNITDTSHLSFFTSILPVDLNNDLLSELVAVEVHSGVYIYPNLSGARLAFGPPLQLPIDTVLFVVAIDLNDDGALDLVAGGSGW